MKRNILVLFALCLVAALALAGCNEKKAGPVIATVDAEKVFQDSKLAQSGMSYVEGIGKEFNDRLSAMQAAIAENPEDSEQIAAFQAELATLQSNFESKQMAAADKLNKLFEEVLEEYRAQHNFEAVLPKQIVVVARPGADITDEIIKLMDTKSIEFGAEPKAEEPAATEAPAGGEAK